ncbi:MAG: 3-deoxy-D-manno-octulosonic acid transferase [Acetobacteraceae bacterium]
MSKASGPLFAWSGAARLAAPGLRLLLRLRAARGKEIASRLGERRGHADGPRPAGALLWLHGASVGESLSLLPLIEEIARRAPELALLVTTGTVTSARLFASRIGEAGLAGRVTHRFAPLDVPGWVARFLDHWRPDALVLVESEIWPNLLAALDRRGVPRMLVNGRLSERSFARWQRLPGTARALFGGFACIAARSEADAARFTALGAARVEVAGDLKFAAPPLPADPALLAALGARIGARPAWLAASTHPGEEAMAFAAHRALAPAHPGLLSIVVPRHPERGAAIAAAARGLMVRRRGAGEGPPDEAGVWIADTLGELGSFYRLAPIVLVGGSLVAHGGQNPLEPARLGCALAVGPHHGNFAEAVARLAAAGALQLLPGPEALAPFVAAMLADPAAREVMGLRAARAAGGYAALPGQLAGSILALLGGQGSR